MEKEYKIGETFEYDSEEGKILLKVISDKEYNCNNCFFIKNNICDNILCAPHERTDNSSVKFIKMKDTFQPFDIVIYKPTGERGLVKSCNGDNTFVLFRKQSTAQCCKTSDLELE